MEQRNLAFADRNLQFNDKKHLFQCKVKYNDEAIKIQYGYYLKLPCNLFHKFGSSRKQKQKPLEEEALNFRVLMACSKSFKKLKEAISLSVYKRNI